MICSHYNAKRKIQEYNEPLISVFVGYEKAFDSVDQDKLINTYAGSRIAYRYAALIRNMYKAQLHSNTSTFKTERGVIQRATSH